MSIERSYTNSDNISVTVDKEHLDKAVYIKKELQNSVFSRKCDWKQHKKLMEQEGIFTSDINENYRMMIREYQRSIGELQEKDKYADHVATGKLECIKQLTGDLYYSKQENRKELLKISKEKRDLTTVGITVEEIRDVFLDDINWSIPHYVYDPKKSSSKNKMLVTLSDLHIGVVVNNCNGNYYNYEIAQKRLALYIKEILDYCKLYNITEVYVCGLGDYLEHLYMRSNQSQDCEFNLAAQIKNASKIIISFLVSLSEYVNVTYEGIGGNHDRMNGDKKANFDDDNANIIINDNIKNFIEQTQAEKLILVNNDEFAKEIILEINGNKIKLIHGDDEGTSSGKLQQHISSDNEFYNLIIQGHLHHYKIHSENFGRNYMFVGCLMGRNTYSKKMKCSTNASQGIVIFREDGKYIPINVDLQIN